jgi:hypothetical protein
MAYTPFNWTDRNVQNPRQYKDQNNNVLILTPDPGTVTEEGTPVTAQRMNALEQGLYTETQTPTNSVTTEETVASISLPSTAVNGMLQAVLKGNTLAVLSRDADTNSYTKLFIRCNGSDGSTVFTDSATSKTVTANGSVRIKENAAYFTGGYLNVASSADFAFGTGDFTFETNIKLNTLPSSYYLIAGQTNPNGLSILITPTSIGVGKSLISVDVIANATIPVGEEFHLAVTRESGTLRVFLNGVKLSEGTYANNYVQGGVNFGIDGDNLGFPLNGYMSSIVLFKGYCKYTATFTPKMQYLSTDHTRVKSYLGSEYTQAIIPVSLKSVGNVQDEFDCNTGKFTKNISDAGEVLATPEIYYYLPTNLQSYPSGTIVQEGYVSDWGRYDNGIDTGYPAYPIDSLDYVNLIDPETGMLTPVTLTDCTVASNGLSFTISSASIGDYYDFGYTTSGLTTVGTIEYSYNTNLKAQVNSNTEMIANIDKKVDTIQKQVIISNDNQDTLKRTTFQTAMSGWRF